MKIFKEIKLSDWEGSNKIICGLMGDPFLEGEDSDTSFEIKYYTDSITQPKFVTLHVLCKKQDDVYMSLALDKGADASPDLIPELTRLASQLKIVTVFKKLNDTNKYEFTGAPDAIKKLFPALQKGLLKERYTHYNKKELKPLSELLVYFYQKITANIKKPAFPSFSYYS